jgi:hypothetical protein
VCIVKVISTPASASAASSPAASGSTQDSLFTDAGPGPDQFLGALIEKYGRTLCDEPQRFDAMLCDLCPGYRRERFLLIAALREKIVEDMIASAGVIPRDAMLTKWSHKLREALGLSENAARWTAEIWLAASQVASRVPYRVEAETPPSPAAATAHRSTAGSIHSIDWEWLAWCMFSLVCAAASVGSLAWVSERGAWHNFTMWLRETSVLAAGLAVPILAVTWCARRLSHRDAPAHRKLSPALAAGAMLPEVLTLLALPVVPVAIPAIWTVDWIAAATAANADALLSFHLGRMLQTFIVIAFLRFWLPPMVTLQGRIAGSLIREP